MSELTITVKYGKEYDQTWAVFKGATVRELRELVADYYALPPGSLEGLSMHEMVVHVTRLTHGMEVLSQELGATPLGSDDTPSDEPTGAAAWEAVPTDPYAELIQALETAPTVDKLKALWAANKDAFEEERVQLAYSARGKALTDT